MNFLASQGFRYTPPDDNKKGETSSASASAQVSASARPVSIEEVHSPEQVPQGEEPLNMQGEEPMVQLAAESPANEEEMGPSFSVEDLLGNDKPEEEFGLAVKASAEGGTETQTHPIVFDQTPPSQPKT